MDEREQAEVLHNKAVRGYIIRSLVKGYNNSALTRQISNAMIAAGLIISPDITKHLNYLADAGYIEFTDQKVTACKGCRGPADEGRRGPGGVHD